MEYRLVLIYNVILLFIRRIYNLFIKLLLSISAEISQLLFFCKNRKQQLLLYSHYSYDAWL
jgi:hypothetical protein